MFNKNLNEQAQRLQSSIQRREIKRDRDKAKRQKYAERDDDYDQHPQKQSGIHSTEQGPMAATYRVIQAISRSEAIQKQKEIVCELCQATFQSNALYQQHVNGAAHKKAVQRKRAAEQAEAERAQSQYYQAAKDALNAAQWTNSSSNQDFMNTTAGPRWKGQQTTGKLGSKQDQQKQTKKRTSQDTQTVQQTWRHSDIVKHATKVDEALTIDGWAPPSISINKATHDQQQKLRTAQSPGTNSCVPAKAGAVQSECAVPAKAIVKREGGNAATPSSDDKSNVHLCYGLQDGEPIKQEQFQDGKIKEEDGEEKVDQKGHDQYVKQGWSVDVGDTEQVDSLQESESSSDDDNGLGALISDVVS